MMPKPFIASIVFLCFHRLPEMLGLQFKPVADRRSYANGLVGSFSFISTSEQLCSPAVASEELVDPRLKAIRDSRDALQSLLDNWSKAVIDCTYADIPKELLETKNKEKLLEKASTFALFDKSVSVVSCKTSNRIVRDYLGRTGKGPLVGLEKNLQKSLSLVGDPDDLDAFVQASESLQQSLSKADSFSYAAGVADFSAVNNFDKEDELSILASNSNLEQTRLSIRDAVQNLDLILAMLDSKEQ